MRMEFYPLYSCHFPQHLHPIPILFPVPFYPSPPANLIQDRGQGVRPQAKDCRKC